VSQNRSERQFPQLPESALAIETLRRSAEACQSPPKEENDDNRISIFWRVFGGTLLSIVALVVMTAYQQINGGLGEVRTEIGHLNTDLNKDLARLSESQGNLVKKEEFAASLRSIQDDLRQRQSAREELEQLKDRCRVLADLCKAGLTERRQLHTELQKLREERAGDEERQASLLELQTLRERLARLEGRQPTPPTEKHEDTHE
jgi:hypothetical protein